MSANTCTKKEHFLSATQGKIWIIADSRGERKQVSNMFACLSSCRLRIKNKECHKTTCLSHSLFPRLEAALRTKTLHKTMSYQAECCVLVLRCWCPVGVPESRCGKGVTWTRNWRRSRCPPQQPPCGTPPCPPPDGPPTASAGLGQVTQRCWSDRALLSHLGATKWLFTRQCFLYQWQMTK